MSLIQNSDEAKKAIWYLLYGPPKSGKTSASATMSKFCPEELPNKGEKIHLSDMVYFMYDTGGTLAFNDLNLSVPMIEFSDLTDYGALVRREREAFKEVSQNIVDGKTKTVVIDTLSSRDAILVNHFLTVDPDNTQKAYGNVKKAHTDFGKRLLDFPVGTRVILLTHAKEVTFDKEGKMATGQDAKIGERSEIVPLITGNGAEYFIGHVSFLLWLSTKRVKGQKPTREFVTSFSGKRRSGGRGENTLNEREPANFSLLEQKLGY